MTTLNPIADAVEGAISGTIGPLFTRLIDYIPDPVEKAKQAAIVQQQLLAADAAVIAQQNAINLAEASNSNVFVSGWRPFIGWVCGFGLAWNIVFAPFFRFAIETIGFTSALPTIDNSFISLLLVPMLGLGAMKTYERVNGVSNEGQKPTQMIAVLPSQALLNLPSTPMIDSNKMQSVFGSGR